MTADAGMSESNSGLPEAKSLSADACGVGDLNDGLSSWENEGGKCD